MKSHWETSETDDSKKKRVFSTLKEMLGYLAADPKTPYDLTEWCDAYGDLIGSPIDVHEQEVVLSGAFHRRMHMSI